MKTVTRNNYSVQVSASSMLSQGCPTRQVDVCTEASVYPFSFERLVLNFLHLSGVPQGICICAFSPFLVLIYVFTSVPHPQRQ